MVGKGKTQLDNKCDVQGRQQFVGFGTSRFEVPGLRHTFSPPATFKSTSRYRGRLSLATFGLVCHLSTRATPPPPLPGGVEAAVRPRAQVYDGRATQPAGRPLRPVQGGGHLRCGPPGRHLCPVGPLSRRATCRTVQEVDGEMGRWGGGERVLLGSLAPWTLFFVSFFVYLGRFVIFMVFCCHFSPGDVCLFDCCQKITHFGPDFFLRQNFFVLSPGGW